MTSVYTAAGELEGLRRLAAAWHRRVLADEVVAHAFSHGFHPDHTERLAAYWAEALGGPPLYTTHYGDESSVTRMHSGNGPHEIMDHHALTCFDAALTDVGITTDPLRSTLHHYFASTTATLSQYEPGEVPPNLPFPHWTWPPTPTH